MHEKIYSIKDRYDLYLKASDTDIASIINAAGDDKKVYILDSITVTSSQVITSSGITFDSDPDAYIISSTPSLSGMITFSGEGYNVKNLNIMSQEDTFSAIQLNANGVLSNFTIAQNAVGKTLTYAVRTAPNVVASINGRTKAILGTITNKILDATALCSYNIDGQVLGLNIADSLSQHTVLFHSDNPFIFTGNSLTYATTGMELKVINNVTQNVITYNIPLGENLNFSSDGSILYAVIKRDGVGTGTVPSTNLTVANGNLVVDAISLPRVDAAELWYIPIAMRIDSAAGELLHWFFGHGTWMAGTATNVGISGGAGSGNANELLERLKNSLDLSSYAYVTPNIFESDKDTLIDPTSTAFYSISKKGYEFDSGEFIFSLDSLDSSFLVKGIDVSSVRVDFFWASGFIDTNATYQVSRDGGNNWQTVIMSEVDSSSDTYSGIHYFSPEPSDSFTLNVNNTGGTLNASNVIDDSFTLSNTVYIKSFDIDVTKTGSPSGYIRFKFVKDYGGSPSTNTADIGYATNWQQLPLISTGTLTFNTDVVLVQGVWWLVVESDSNYKDTYSAGVHQIAVDGNSLFLTGRESDLRLKVTASSNGVIARGYGLYYYDDTSQASLFHPVQENPTVDYLTIQHSQKNTYLYKWIRVSGTGTLSYSDTDQCKMGRGVWTITGNGTWILADYIPAFVEAEMAGYVAFYGTSGNTALFTAGHYGYDANYALLSDNGGFIINNQAVTTSWQFFKEFCVGVGVTRDTFSSGTTFIRPRISVTSNTGTVYFDAFNIFLVSDESGRIGALEDRADALEGRADDLEALTSGNFLGSTNPAIDQSANGRGIFLRRPDGTLREIAIDDNDNIVVYSV